jgi:hypothetical protein
MKFPLTLVLLFSLVPLAQADVWTYPSPGDQFRSKEYSVKVLQDDEVQQSFTYQDKNPDKKLINRMTDYNHWTTFSFDGSVKIEVTRMNGSAAGAEVRPLAAKIKPVISSSTIGFTITKPGKFWIKFPGMEEHPLFIFADPPETDVPDRNDKNVKWFEGGKVHEIGEKFRVKSGQTIYLEGGAYVKGTITGRNVDNVTIRGRGILSGIDIPRKPGVAGIPWNLIQFDGSGSQTVEGITCIQPPHFVLLSRGNFSVRNTKLFGWYHQTDGWGGGDDSLIEDSFLKVNDDVVKFYGQNQTARRLTIWQQVNGAPFQLGWGGNGQTATNCLAEDITIIRTENTNRNPAKTSNTSLLNLQKQDPESRISGVTIRRVRIEDDALHLLGIKDASGSIAGIQLSDIEIHGKVGSPGYLLTAGSGKVEQISFENIRIGGDKVGSLNWRLGPGVPSPDIR